MRRIILIGLIFFTVFTSGCSQDSSKEKTKKEVKNKKEVMKVLDTKDAMMAKLNEYKITIPEDMVFRSVDKSVYLNKEFEQADTYVIYFDIKDKTKKEALLEWFNNQRQILKDDGWTEKKFEKDIEMMGGGSENKSIMVKESENCTLSIGLALTDEVSSIIINPKYEIK